MKASKPITLHESSSTRKPVSLPVSARKSGLAPYYMTCSALGVMLFGIATLLQGEVNAPHITPDECQYLSHLNLSGQYQQQKDGSVRCQSQVRYLGRQNQHSLRYMASGSQGVVEEMRVSLRLGVDAHEAAIDELIRFGQSLSLPVLGHTMPAEVGQYLRQGHVGHWDFSRASLYIERHQYPVSNAATPAEGKAQGFKDIELVFRKNRLH